MKLREFISASMKYCFVIWWKPSCLPSQSSVQSVSRGGVQDSDQKAWRWSGMRSSKHSQKTGWARGPAGNSQATNAAHPTPQHLSPPEGLRSPPTSRTAVLSWPHCQYLYDLSLQHGSFNPLKNPHRFLLWMGSSLGDYYMAPQIMLAMPAGPP